MRWIWQIHSGARPLAWISQIQVELSKSPVSAGRAAAFSVLGGVAVVEIAVEKARRSPRRPTHEPLQHVGAHLELLLRENSCVGPKSRSSV